MQINLKQANMNQSSQANQEPIDQIFLRCQPKNNNVAKKPRKKKRFDRAKADAIQRQRETHARLSTNQNNNQLNKITNNKSSDSDEQTNMRPTKSKKVIKESMDISSNQVAYDISVTNKKKTKNSYSHDRHQVTQNFQQFEQQHNLPTTSGNINCNNSKLKGVPKNSVHPPHSANIISNKTSKYNASKNLQMQLKVSLTKRNDKNKIKNSNKDSAHSDIDEISDEIPSSPTQKSEKIVGGPDLMLHNIESTHEDLVTTNQIKLETCDDFELSKLEESHNEFHANEIKNDADTINELDTRVVETTKPEKIDSKIDDEDVQNLENHLFLGNRENDCLLNLDLDCHQSEPKMTSKINSENDILKADIENLFAGVELVRKNSYDSTFIASNRVISDTETTIVKTTPHCAQQDIDEFRAGKPINETKEDLFNLTSTDENDLQIDASKLEIDTQNDDTIKSIQAITTGSHSIENLNLNDEQKLESTQTDTLIQHSTLHFDMLSDNESINDEPLSIPIRSNATLLSLYSGSSSKNLKSNERAVSDSTKPSNSTPMEPNKLNTLQREQNGLHKTSLKLPCLDEGLSSEDESCDEFSNDDDERAVDGDVEDDGNNDDDIEQNEYEYDSVTNILTLCENSNIEMMQRNLKTHIHSNQQASTSSNSIYNHADQATMQYSSSNMKQQSSFIDQNILIDQIKDTYYANNVQLNDASKSTIGNSFNDHNGAENLNYWLNQTHQQQPVTNQTVSRNCQIEQSRLLSSNTNYNKNLSNKSSNNNNSIIQDKSNMRMSSDTDNETDRLLGNQRSEQNKLVNKSSTISNKQDGNSLHLRHNSKKANTSSQNQREVLIEGVAFNVKFLGTTQLECNEQTEKNDRSQNAQLAVQEVKSRMDPSSISEVQLFVSTEKIMILDNERKKIITILDLKTISYTADIDDCFVLIVMDCKRPNDTTSHSYKASCHVFESLESHTITKSIDQAFQVAYAELRKNHGINDSNYMNRDSDLQEVLNSQETPLDELNLLSCRENHLEIAIPKKRGEILGIVIVESGWGSMLPTVVISSIKHESAAHRCKELSFGDQILSIDGVNLVTKSLAECQEVLKNTICRTITRMVIVKSSFIVRVKIKRPNTKYALGFSVQDGVICSLLRGGIAERGGVRVGHRILSINGIRVVMVPHEKIVALLANSVGEIRMETILNSLYRHLSNLEKPMHQ